jgi:hypothetical protein
MDDPKGEVCNSSHASISFVVEPLVIHHTAKVCFGTGNTRKWEVDMVAGGQGLVDDGIAHFGVARICVPFPRGCDLAAFSATIAHWVNEQCPDFVRGEILFGYLGTSRHLVIMIDAAGDLRYGS